MASEVFGLRDQRVIGVETLSLRSTYVGQAELSCQIGIFAKVLFDAPPAGLAPEIEHGAENHPDAGRTGLGCDGSPGSLRDSQVPCRCQIDGRGEHCSRIESVQ